MVLSNIILPQFLFEYLVVSYLLVSIIEGVILNIGIKKIWYYKTGLWVSAFMNFVTTIVGTFFGFLVAYFGIVITILTAYLLSTLIEFLLISGAPEKFQEIKNHSKMRLFTIVLIANTITYIIIWFTFPYMM